MSKNDQKILKLKEQIELKKSKLKKAKKFQPITNCILEFEGNKHNLNVLNEESSVELLVRLNIYKMSLTDLNLSDNVLIFSGYELNDWISDVRSKMENLSVKKEERNLKIMESKLDKMLSEEKKTELELDEIEKLLN